MAVRHFLSLNDISHDELQHLLIRGIELKNLRSNGGIYNAFAKKVLVMIFEKSSTRTRIAFESAMAESGGHAIFLSPRDAQFGRGETVEDTARVVSRMCHAIMIRANTHKTAELLAANSSVPVINGLTDRYHPCQLLADMQTYLEHRGSIEGKKVVWVGDGNNMCNSYVNASVKLNFHLVIACPEAYQPDGGDADLTDVEITTDPVRAVTNADLVVTDVWASMGYETEQQQRRAAFENFQVNRELLAHANSDALFMHCLPAHRGEEVSAQVIDAKDSIVWGEAENRLHAQKALLEFLFEHG